MLKFVEETLDEIAFAIEDEVAQTWNFSGELGRNDRCDASPVEAFDESVGIEGFVGDQSAWINGFDQRFGAGQIMSSLASGLALSLARALAPYRTRRNAAPS